RARRGCAMQSSASKLWSGRFAFTSRRPVIPRCRGGRAITTSIGACARTRSAPAPTAASEAPPRPRTGRGGRTRRVPKMPGGEAETLDGAASQTRVAVVDIGTNSTRLLVADVGDGRVQELERRSRVTRLGRGVDL